MKDYRLPLWFKKKKWKSWRFLRFGYWSLWKITFWHFKVSKLHWKLENNRTLFKNSNTKWKIWDLDCDLENRKHVSSFVETRVWSSDWFVFNKFSSNFDNQGANAGMEVTICQNLFFSKITKFSNGYLVEQMKPAVVDKYDIQYRNLLLVWAFWQSRSIKFLMKEKKSPCWKCVAEQKEKLQIETTEQE